jgi:hypothetical protein
MRTGRRWKEAAQPETGGKCPVFHHPPLTPAHLSWMTNELGLGSVISDPAAWHSVWHLPLDAVRRLWSCTFAVTGEVLTNIEYAQLLSPVLLRYARLW